MKVSSLGTAGFYFFHFGKGLSEPANSPWGKVFMKGDGSGNIQFAVQKQDGAISGYAGTSIAESGNHLFVVGYRFGGANTDTVLIWVDPPTETLTESTPLIKWDDGVDPDNAINLDGVVFHQLGSPDSRTIQIAGLRVTDSWANATLPIQLLAFTATATRLDVNLRWSTATEVNNFGFDVERRAVDGVENWQKVGFVPGSGTTTDPREYTFVDGGLLAGRYAYRIKQVDLDGTFSYFTATEVEVGAAPRELALEPNYPNPFNPATQISFSVPEDGKAVLKIYNMLGQEVAVLFDEIAEAGKLYQKTFDASSLPTGVYVSRLEYGGRAAMRKMLFVK
jgi:hypothetical protein